MTSQISESLQKQQDNNVLCFTNCGSVGDGNRTLVRCSSCESNSLLGHQHLPLEQIAKLLEPVLENTPQLALFRK